MSTVATPSKSEVLLKLAIAAHIPQALDPGAQRRIRSGFKAIIAAVRKIDGVPATDIDQFIQDVQKGASSDALMAPAVLLATSLPDEDYYAALMWSGMFEGMVEKPPAKATYHPKFEQAMVRIKELQDQHGEEAMKLPECDVLWAVVFEFAPPQFMQVVRDTAEELGLLPETKYVDDAGEPMYSAEQIAEKLGIPVEQVEQDIREKIGCIPVVGNVHLVQ